MFVLSASESKWTGLITLGKFSLSDFFGGKKELQDSNQVQKREMGKFGVCCSFFLFVWEKTSLVCSLLEAGGAAEVHWASTV